MRGIKRFLRWMPRISEVITGLVAVVLGALVLTGGNIYIRATDESELVGLNLPQNTFLAILLALAGVWFIWVGPRLQLRINRRLRIIYLWFKYRILGEPSRTENL